MSTVQGTMKTGLVISGTEYPNFEMREATVEDMLDAEMDAGVHTPLNFNAQMLLRQLVNVKSRDDHESFSGPFSIEMIRKLKPHDFRVLRAKQQELDALGEAG
ncbi:MAG: hypothetical protein WC208_09585 [Gallionella sp.]